MKFTDISKSIRARNQIQEPKIVKVDSIRFGDCLKKHSEQGL